MLTAIKGYYENGQIILREEPPVSEKTEVIITFLTEENVEKKTRRQPGGLKGRVTLPDDFDDPVDDLRDYM
jgi:hypothetical protein